MKAKVLIVDDEKSMRISLREFLKDDNYEVEIAEDADGAKKILKAGNIDVILTDIILPRITGVELLKSIKETSPNTQVILMTGEPTVATASEAVRTGAFDYITKPIDKEQLLRTIANAAKAKALNDDRRRLEEQNIQYRNNLEYMVEQRTMALYESESQNRLLVTNALSCIHQIDLNGRQTSMNPAGLEMMGVAKESEIIGMEYLDIVAESDRNRVAELMRDAFIGKQSRFEFLATNGSYFASSFVPITDDENNVVRLMGLTDDITERKRAEKIILDKQKQLDDLFANVDAIVLEGTPKEIYFVGGRVEEILGYPKVDWFADPNGPMGFWMKCLHPDDANAIQTCVEAIERCENHTFEYRMIAADGRVVWFYDRVTIESENGKPTKTRSVMIDITERKKAEREIRKADERFRLAFEIANIAICLVDLEESFARVNEQMCQMFGYSREELEHMTVKELTHPDSKDVSHRFIQRATTGEIDDTDYIKRYIHKDGHDVWGDVSISIIRDELGNPLNFIAYILDITERVQHEKEMKERKARLSLVKDMAMEITSDMSIEEVVTDSLKSIFKMLPNYRVSYGQKLDSDVYRCMASEGPSNMENIKGTDFDMTNAIEFIEALTKGHVVTNDIMQNEMVEPLREQLKEIQVRSMINTPVLHAAGLKGLLWLDSDVHHVWSDHEIITLENVSRFLAVAVKNAQLTEERTKTSEALKIESAELIEKNIALNQVLEHLEKEKQNYKEQISESVESLLMPVIKKLKKKSGNLSPKDIALLENSVNSIVGKEIDVFRKNLVKLSPRELDICELIREGKSSKEISAVLNLSTLTVHKHRESIRNKLQLKNKSTNLSAYLRTREFLTVTTQ